MKIKGLKLNGIKVIDSSFVTENQAIWVDANNSLSFG